MPEPEVSCSEPEVTSTTGASSSDSRGLVGAVGSVAVLTLVSRALGFLRWVVQASTVGAGVVAGAYASANQVPNVLYEVVVGGALAATVVPLLATPLARGRRQEAAHVAGGLLGLVLVVLVPLGGLLALLAGPISLLFPVSHGADPAAQHALVADFLRMFALQVPLYGIGVVLTGVLQAHGRFTWPTITPIFSSLVVMASYGVYAAMAGAARGAAGAGTPSSTALSVLGWGTTAGVAALCLPLVIPVRRLGVRLRPHLHLGRAHLARAARLGGAGLFTLLAQQLSVLVVMAMARSGGEAGTVAVYQYVQAIYLLPYAVLAVPVATVTYPRTSRLLARSVGQGAEPAPRARRLVGGATALVVTAAVAGAGALVAVAYGAERFFSLLTRVPGMEQALVVLAPGVVGYALIYQVTRVLLAADRSRTAALAAGSGWLVVSVASVVGVRWLAPHGGDGAATVTALGLALTLGTTVSGLALLAALASALGTGALRPVLRALVVSVPLAALGGYAVLRLSHSLASGPTWLVLVVSILGALAVAALSAGATLLTQRSVLACLRGPDKEKDDD